MHIITTLDSDGYIKSLLIPEDPKEAKDKIRLIFKVLNYEMYDELEEAIEELNYDFIQQDLEDAGIVKQGRNLIEEAKEITKNSTLNFLEA